MLEAGVPLTVVASILGWSGSTMVLMAKRYGHIGAQAKQDAVAMLDRLPTEKVAEESDQSSDPSGSVN